MRIDARGKSCPIPVVMATKALEELPSGESLELLVNEETAVQNLTRMGAQKGCTVTVEQQTETEYCVRLLRTEQATATVASPLTCPSCTPISGTVVVIDAAEMGRGDAELGKLLMKGFLYAVREGESLPATILCYNGGVQLTTEGSDSLEDLRALEAEGVEILSCGTCLNFYGLTDKLAVGSVTNMYTIADKLQKAERVVKP